MSSKLVDYKAQAEQLREDLSAQIPEDTTVNTFVESHHVPGHPSPGAVTTAWWQVRDERTLIEQDGVAHQAAQAIADYLSDEGWKYTSDARQKTPATP